MSDLPIVTLAGKEYRVPLLVPRQQRIVLPAIMRSGESIGVFIKALETSSAKEFPLDAYDDLLSVAFWGAMWPNDKTMTRDFILEIPVTFAELVKAFMVVQVQTGLYAKVEQSGEAQAEAQKK